MLLIPFNLLLLTNAKASGDYDGDMKPFFLLRPLLPLCIDEPKTTTSTPFLECPTATTTASSSLD
jgi:hypothetical protein